MVLYYDVCVACDEVTQPSALESSAPPAHTHSHAARPTEADRTPFWEHMEEREQKMPFFRPPSPSPLGVKKSGFLVLKLMDMMM
jgi:hypothetical protein